MDRLTINLKISFMFRHRNVCCAALWKLHIVQRLASTQNICCHGKQIDMNSNILVSYLFGAKNKNLKKTLFIASNVDSCATRLVKTNLTLQIET